MPPRRVESVIRSGRFKIPDATAATSIIVDRTGNGVYYRIFNTGKNAFIVIGTSSTANPTVQPGCSLDCRITATNVQIQKTTTGGAEVEGVYDGDLLAPEIRSGRFSLPGGASGGAPPTNIIEFTGANRRAVYRIYNSGLKPITVKLGATAKGTIPAESSLDLELPVTAAQLVSVNGDPGIEGIYELIFAG